jgi:hypothetical protein
MIRFVVCVPVAKWRKHMQQRDGVQVYLADDSSIEVAQQHCPCGHLVFLEVMLRHRGNTVIAKRGVAALPPECSRSCWLGLESMSRQASHGPNAQ